MALVVGCAIAAWFESVAGEPPTATALKVVTLLLLESAADVLKGAAFAAYKIDLGHVSYNLTFITVLGIGGAVGAAVGELVINVRATCLIGDTVANLLGY